MPLDTFVNFAGGSDVVIHESVGPVWNFSTSGVAGINILLVSHGFMLQQNPYAAMYCFEESLGV